ncbi:MAG: fibronectin type III domain-containing protein, partial [Mycobacteriales bacterium]
MTPAFVLPGAPTGLVADPNPAPAAVSLTWVASTRAAQTATTSYTVTVSPAVGSVAYPVDRSTTGATVSGLTNGTSYSFTVVANNSAGASAPSTSASATPYTVPTVVRTLSGSVGDKVADLTWTAPASDGGRAVSGYQAVLNPGAIVGTVSGTTAHFTGLTNGTSYTASVNAVNQRGAGPAATTGPLQPASVPGAPTGATASAGNGAATVSWTAPASDGGKPITGYTVTSSPGAKTCTSSTTSCSVTGLTNGTAYTFTVTATNSLGSGPASAASNSVTPRPAASTISGLAATSTTAAKPASTVTGTVSDASSAVALVATDSKGAKVAGAATVSSGGAFTGSLDLSSLVDGVVTVTATATDTTGQVGPTASTTTSKDATAPVVSALTATASTGDEPASQITGKVDDAAATLKVTATDKNSKSVSATPAQSGGSFSTSLDLSSLADGPISVTVVATDAVGNAGSATVATTRDATARGSRFAGLSPTRLLDTRSGLGAPAAPVAPKGTLVLQVTGQGGVPASGVASVVLNVTVVAPTSAGYLTVYPSGGVRPVVSNLNFTKGQTVPNLVVVPVSSAGTVSFFNGQAGRTDLLADVAGYYSAGSTTSAGAFGSLAPARILDTRSGVGAPAGAVAAKATLPVQVLGRGGVPTTGVSAVVVNVTVVDPTSSGYLTVYPSGGSRPVVSNLNFAARTTVHNLVIVPVGADGKIALFNGSGGRSHLLADVAGYYVSGTPSVAGSFVPVAPTRVLDTRSGNGAPPTAVPARSTLTLTVRNRGGVPATGASAVVLNVTAVDPASGGYLTVWPSGGVRPVVSNLNFTPRTTIANLVVVPIGPDGKVQLFNGSG